MSGVYGSMKFPVYEFREYPKHIQLGAGKFVEVNSPQEEKEAREEHNLVIDDSAPAETSVEDPAKRSELLAKAKALGVAVNVKWSAGKIAAAIAEAEAADAEEADDDSDSADKDGLINKAKSLGINANKTWGTAKIKSAIAELDA